ncbi:hypothetical protein PAAG_01199 [Paracoccidioides lutzii Pb01]|uniref:Pheromone-regulated membrane protein n=1 Tax=Paracoccidioides lutzii (strain ATCC MYA-826 / Pb01) TaxID=502779 RepID=C1GRQ4_PARBA|nr:hypothetical protein PAAG_01199 [Paracoccidioides lutzii Pb01]EEH38278.2 hypothetical protein PAAG_01199 [Paracoccidioides lutzii Pb01]
MGCCTSSRKEEYWGHMRAEQKWEYINLSDFKSTSCFTQFSYFILWVSVFISIAVYGVDTFTAVNLIAFNRWSTEREQLIPRHISKWIFSGCIMLSFVLLVCRWIRAVRVIKQGGVAQSYLDPLAVRIQSIRMGENGRGWRRFLVFYALTKSKKGADYVALFTYFNFEAWTRVVIAEGPRQFINATILYSVMESDLILRGEHAPPKGISPVAQFFFNVRTLADKDQRQAVVLSAMFFTLVIWVVSILSLFVSCILYLLFLWHHIPSEDGSLTAYCRRKINIRFERIVKEKVDKVLAKDVVLQDRQLSDSELGIGSFKRQPTLPTFRQASSDKPPEMPTLSRQTTLTTLPPYSLPPTAGPNSYRQPTLPELNWSNEDLSMGSNHISRLSDDNVPLVKSGGVLGYTNEPRYNQSGPPTLDPIDTHGMPLSLMAGPRPHEHHSPAALDSSSTLNEQQFSFLPAMPAISDRRSPVDRSQFPTPARAYTPRLPSNNLSSSNSSNDYQHFSTNSARRSPAPPNQGTPDLPLPLPPVQQPFRNFARPATTSPSTGYRNGSRDGNRSVPDRSRLQRSGTAPPQQNRPTYGGV